MKKLLVLAVLVLTLVVGVVSPAAADDTATVKLFDEAFRQSVGTEVFWADGMSDNLDSLDSGPVLRVFDDPFAHSPLDAILVKDGNDIFKGPYTKQEDKLFTVVGNQIKIGRPGADPSASPNDVVYTIENDGRHLRVYAGNYTRFRNIIYTIADGNLYEGAYPRLSTLVFSSIGDVDSILELLPILADGAF